jgi:hypothetical protein
MIVGDDALDLPAVVDAVDLAERDETLDLRAQLFRLRQRGDDAFLIDERGELVAEQRIAVAARPPQLSIRHSVSH